MNWPMVKLGDVATVNPRAPKELDSAQIVSFVGMASVSEDGYLQSEEPRVLEETKKGFTYFAKSDVLIAKITPCFENGKCLRPSQISNPIGFGSTEFHVLRPDESRLDATYLFYMIWSNQFRALGAASMSGAAGQKRVGSDFLKNFEIPLPPLTEQKCIAAILDKADAICRKRQQAIQLADDFLRAVFLEMFGDPVTNPKGWEVKPLRDVLKSISSGWSANGDSRSCEEGELGVLKISAVTSGTFIPTENKAVQVSDIPSSKKLVFPKKGDMLFSRANTRELVAASCIVVEDSLNTFLPDKLWVIKTDESQLLPEFLNFLLKIPGFKEKLTSQATGSSGSMLNISMGKFEQTDCLIPPIDLQHRFKNLYWKLQETLSSFGQSESTLQSSFNSLSQQAFSGQL